MDLGQILTHAIAVSRLQDGRWSASQMPPTEKAIAVQRDRSVAIIMRLS
jgi:hypothetical protein